MVTIKSSGKNVRAAVEHTLEKFISDVEQKVINLGDMNDSEIIHHAELVCSMVDLNGGVYSRSVHYFRNRFCRAPVTLQDMADTVLDQSKDRFGWILLHPSSTFFHMAGPEGEYNLKFISSDGHFEAVYDRDGILLTQKNNPMNMGTFNYANPATQRERHFRYDIMPYLKWRNTSDSPPVSKSIEADMKVKFEANHDAKKHYMFYKNLLGF